MSDSEGRKDLSGLARSIDAFFAAAERDREEAAARDGADASGLVVDPFEELPAASSVAAAPEPEVESDTESEAEVGVAEDLEPEPEPMEEPEVALVEEPEAAPVEELEAELVEEPEAALVEELEAELIEEPEVARVEELEAALVEEPEVGLVEEPEAELVEEPEAELVEEPEAEPVEELEAELVEEPEVALVEEPEAALVEEPEAALVEELEAELIEEPEAELVEEPEAELVEEPEAELVEEPEAALVEEPEWPPGDVETVDLSEAPVEDLEGVEPEVSDEAGEGVQAAEEPGPAERAAAADEGEEPEPGPLELAVEAFLDGEGDSEAVLELASGHVDERAYDPVAWAVQRLGAASKGEAGADATELALALLSPFVQLRFVQRLGSERDEARREALYAFCATVGETMAEAIRDELAESTDRSARRVYYDALVAMGDASRAVIESMAVDDNRFLARNGIAILGEIGGAGADELVLAALENTDARVRREAVRSAARLSLDEAKVPLVALLEDAEPSVREAAVAAAGELRIDRAVPPLLEALGRARDPGDLVSLLHALGRIADPAAVPAIEKRSARPRFGRAHSEVRVAAYQALSHIGTPHARALLEQATSDPDEEVRTAVASLLAAD